jgi:hypothetical protein
MNTHSFQCQCGQEIKTLNDSGEIHKHINACKLMFNLYGELYQTFAKYDTLIRSAKNKQITTNVLVILRSFEKDVVHFARSQEEPGDKKEDPADSEMDGSYVQKEMD